MTLKKLLFLVCTFSLILTGCTAAQKNMAESLKKEPEIAQQTEESEEIIYDTTQFDPPQPGEEIAVMTTNKGVIKMRLFPEYAPKAVENFATHAKNGYYDGLTFHRVINDFMIQGGDPEGTGRGGESIWGKPFEDEFHPYALNFRGALAMANSGPNTNGSQFFIVQKKTVEEDMLKGLSNSGYPEAVVKLYEEKGGTPWLDGVHTVFGQVFEGMDVVDAIAAVETDEHSAPTEAVIIEKIEIVSYEG